MNNLKPLTLITLFFLLSITLPAQNYHEIQWKIERPFKFFTEKNVYYEMKKIYDNIDKNIDNLPEKSKGLAFERALHSKFKSYQSRGWATHFATGGYKNTCWDRKKMQYKTDGICSNYINPKYHKVEVNLTNTSKNDTCTWLINNIQKKDSSSCSNQTFKIPYEEESTISVKINNREMSLISKNIQIEDILIVGLGDSFGSGEGNPDQPVTFHNDEDDKDVFLVENIYLPKKDKDNNNKYQPAQWIDRRAHRSLYSYQFKTALQYSLEHPTQAVTFISYSSSGGKTDNIIGTYKEGKESLKDIYPRFDGEQSVSDALDGKEDNSKDRLTFIRPQLDLLKEITTYDINESRDADIILLSTGGNDVGFAKYVAYILGGIAKVLDKTPNEDTIATLDFTLFRNYYNLNNKLIDFVKDKNSSRILLSSYPNILYNENKEICEVNRREFTIPFGSDVTRKNKVVEVENFLLKPLLKTQRNLAQELNWTFVDGHVEKYFTHGFCAQNKHNIYNNVNEQFVMPHKLKKDDEWIPFIPKEYKAYESKQRWVRLPIDSLLTINQSSKFLWFDTDFILQDELSGVMHPTAEGLSVIADENLKAVNKLLN